MQEIVSFLKTQYKGWCSLPLVALLVGPQVLVRPSLLRQLLVTVLIFLAR